jgi:hypothetical protein
MEPKDMTVAMILTRIPIPKISIMKKQKTYFNIIASVEGM